MAPRIAVLGASGFVGSRLVELWHLTGLASVRPVVRNVGSLARLARFDLDWRLADASDQVALTAAFQGCDAVVNLIVGNPDVILANATASYRAAQAAGVKRMVFMSSASVHGQAPAPGTDETSPLHTRHRFAYNNAKVLAERALTELRDSGSVELVILRPGIVYGPRSRWVSDIANQLLADRGYLINGGAGICNAIYVDNLIDAIEQSLTSASADRQVFLVGDPERVTWCDVYATIARALGRDLTGITQIDPPHFPRGLKHTLSSWRGSKPVQALLPLVPATLKQAVKGAIKAATAAPNPSRWQLPTANGPVVSEEITQLQLCSVRLPCTKAERILGYQPKVSFAEGMQRSIGWLKFAGYPIQR